MYIHKVHYINHTHMYHILCRTYTNVAFVEREATISRMLKNIGLFCKRALQKCLIHT